MRVPATAWLSRLDAARTQALAGEAEGVHQVRVSLRRLRVWLRFEGHRALRREVRWVCRALAELRDLDVFESALDPKRIERLRPTAEHEASRALRSSRYERLRTKLEKLRPPRARAAHELLAKLERRLERQRRRAPAFRVEALHALRRLVRRVRYTREWLGLDASALRQEQEQLGAVCDLLALEAFALRNLVKPPPVLSAGIERSTQLLAEHRP